MFPDPPEFTESQLHSCKDSDDFRPVLFEWYKHVAKQCTVVACFLQESPTISKTISHMEYGILVGLLNRCCRLMQGNITLSKEGIHGESTSILDRSIFESCIKLCWLCENTDSEKYKRFIASCLKTEIELEEKIQENIDARDGTVLKIEERILIGTGALKKRREHVLLIEAVL